MKPQELSLRLAAILVADAVAYSRLMSADERATIEALETARGIFQTISEAHSGRVVDTAGDSVLAIFETAAGAATAALAIQQELEACASAWTEDRRLRFRVGVHLGDVMQKADGSVYGDGVNVAARLQNAAPAGGIVVSESIRLAVRGKLAAHFEDLGEQTFKNIAEPIRAHRMSSGEAGLAGRASSSVVAPAISPGPRRLSKRLSLAWLVLAVAVCAAVVAAYVGFHERMAPLRDAIGSDAARAPLSILVLPFANQTGDETKGYIADAMTLSVTTDLSRLRDVFVVPATTAFTYRSKGWTVQQIAHDAAVRFVLEGSVLASGQQMRVTASLVDARSGAQLWNESFQGELSNLFALQDQVTVRVGNSIGEHMVIVAARESQTRESSPQVVDLIMRARALGFRPQSSENFREQERLLREALSLEPDNASTMVRLASELAVHTTLLDGSDPVKGNLLTEGRDLALRAKAIDPGLPGLEVALSIYAMEHNDFDGARRAMEAMIAKDPKNPGSYNNLARFHRLMGEPERALPLLKQALALYPKGREAIFGNMGLAHLELGQDDEAIEWLLRALDRNTESLDTNAGLAMAYSNKGDAVNASRYANKYRKLAAAQGFKGIEGNAPPPGSPPAFLKYYQARLVPEWKRAGLP